MFLPSETKLKGPEKRAVLGGFPGDSVVKNPLTSAIEVRSLIQEGPTCCGAAKPTHNY